MRTLLVMLLAALALGVASAAPPPNLLANGDFTLAGKQTAFASWTPLSKAGEVTRANDASLTFATIASTDATTVAGISQLVPINPEWQRLLVRGFVRLHDITPNGSGAVEVSLKWQGSGSSATPPIDFQTWTAGTATWVEVNQLLVVPPGAVGLTVAPELNDITGSADFRDLSVTGWVSTLDDEFDGNSVDNSRWTVSEGIHNVSVPESEWFSPDHVTVANGILRIHGEQVPHGGLPYQSGEISSKGKFQQLYGLFEFRLKVPGTIGIWPAAYLLKWDDGWPPEIDVEEMSGNDMRTVLETNHFADDYGRHSQTQVNWDGSAVNRQDWHTYAVIWEPGQVAWYFDGIYKGTTHAVLTSNVPMYVRMNMAIGSYGGDPSKGTWPQDFDCDYIHVFERQDLPLPVYPIKSEEITLPVSTAALSAISCNPITGAAVTWTELAGPKAAAIDDPHSLNTRAKFSAPGMYHFHVDVTKGASSGGQDLLVYVDPARGRGGG